MFRPSVLGAALVPTVVAVLLLFEAVFMPGALSAGELRVLAGVSALALAIAVIELLRRHAAFDARAKAVSRDARRILEGDVHVFVASPADDPLGELTAVVNELADTLRSGRLNAESERALDHAMGRESPNGLIITDGKGRVMRHNPSFARLMPVTADPIGKMPIETIPVAELQDVIDETTRTRAQSERTASVGRREVVLRGVPLADGEGTLGVVLDITSVRQAERARRDFVANVSHELRTPITAVVGYAESLLQDKDQLPAWSLPMIEAIDRNGRRLGALIEDVLHLSRIEARQDDLRLERERLRPLVEEVMARFDHAAKQKTIQLTLEDGPDAEARVNAEAFGHALGNLVDNAIKYSPSGGRVTVAVAPDGPGARVAVTDEGIGIAQVHHERVFERFYRVDPGRSRDVGGTGLGLALVKHLCLAMNAEVSLDSEPGKGSRFTLRLPG